MFTLPLQKADLRAALHIAAKNDVRYYLNGVLIECSATESRIVATDGHVLCAIKSEAPQQFEGEPMQSLIIPRDVVAKIKKPTRRAVLPSFVVLAYDGKTGTLTVDGSPDTFRPIDGRFPDWRRVFPKTVSGITGQYDPELMVRFSKASGEYCKGSAFAPIPAISHNLDADSPRASKAAVVTIDRPEFIGLIMPCHLRNEIPADPVPAWARETLGEAKPETATA